MPPLRDKHYDVVVVGAGLAGLNVARRLASCGYGVCVLEARDRVGGRAETIELCGRPYDVGGQWVGPSQHRLIRLADELGATRYDQHHHGRKVLELAGKRSSYTGSLPSMSIPDLLRVEWLMRRVDRMAGTLHLEAPYEAHRAREWDARTLAGFRDEQLGSETTRALFDVAVRMLFGAEPAEMSLLYFLYYVNAAGSLRRMLEIEGGAQAQRFARGVQPLAEQLAARTDAQLLLNTPVRRIEQHADRVTLTTEDGQSHHGRYAVVAIPPPLCAGIRFEPLLPTERRQLLQRWPMGATVKVLAFYERASWRERGFSGEAVCSAGPLTTVFDNGSADGKVAGLLGFVVGRKARQWASMPADERKRLALGEFERLLGAPAREAIAYAERDWAQERWTGGCPVAAMACGQLTGFGAAWRAPVGRIWWAGTETSRHWNGYLEGALESAERVASELLERLATPHRGPEPAAPTA